MLPGMPQLSMTRWPGSTEIPIVSPGHPWRFPYVRETRIGDESHPRWTENTRRYSENRRGERAMKNGPPLSDAT